MLASNVTQTISGFWAGGLMADPHVGLPAPVKTGGAEAEPPPDSMAGSQGRLTTVISQDLVRLLDLPSGTYEWQPEPGRARRANAGGTAASDDVARAQAQLNKNVFTVGQWIRNSKTAEEWAARGVSKDSMLAGLRAYAKQSRLALIPCVGGDLMGKPAVPTTSMLFHMAFTNAEQAGKAAAAAAPSTTQASTPPPVVTTTTTTAAPVVAESNVVPGMQKEMLRLLSYFMKRTDLMLPQYRRGWPEIRDLSQGRIEFSTVGQAALACPPASMLHPDKKNPGRFTAVYPHVGPGNQSIVQVFVGRKPAIVAHGEKPHSVRVSLDGGKSWQTPDVYTDDHVVQTQLRGWQGIFVVSAGWAEFWKKQSLWLKWKR